jgi:nucleotide-binding universal stress UspA family protein
MGIARSGPVVMGIAAGTPDRVIEEAVELARDLSTELACVYVDETRVPVGEAPDGTVVTAPISAGGTNTALEVDTIAGSEVTSHVGVLARKARVTLTFHVLAGDPVTALARFAVDHRARLIVVGTRRPGVRASLEVLVAGPVASRLARRQTVPVVVVPVHDRSPLSTAEVDELAEDLDTLNAAGDGAGDAAEVPEVPEVPDPADVLFGEGHA